jgi:phosphatidylserine decarboxylase
MEAAKPLSRLSTAERLNFLLTNRLPRRYLTLFMGWFSKIENPLVRSLSIGTWKLFADDLRLFEAKKSRFTSMHDCFIRELKAGARTVDPDASVLTSPCDAIVGEFGEINGHEAIQAKGFPYSIEELLGSAELAATYRNGRFLTLRLKSSMYHRFHAPCAGRVRSVNYISGDTWNVNPVALKVVERLFCKNERAVMTFERGTGDPVTLVPVAAILVASMRLHGLEEALNLKYRGPNHIPTDLEFEKGDEVGYFEHGSTIVLFVTESFRFEDKLRTGMLVRMGEALMRASQDTTDRIRQHKVRRTEVFQ